jgi:hypothetical protein
VCQCVEKDFSARAETSGDGRTLTVEGQCTCRQGGFMLELEPDNPGIVPQPDEVVLRLKPTPPEAGTDALTLTPVRYVEVIGPEAERVIIRLPDEQDEIVLAISDKGSY